MKQKDKFLLMMGALFLSLLVLLNVANYIPNREVFLVFSFYFAEEVKPAGEKSMKIQTAQEYIDQEFPKGKTKQKVGR